MSIGSDPDIENARKGILNAYDHQNIISNKSQSKKTWIDKEFIRDKNRCSRELNRNA